MYIAVIANNMDHFQRWCRENNIRKTNGKYHLLDDRILIKPILREDDVRGLHFIDYKDITYYNPTSSWNELKRLNNLRSLTFQRVRTYLNYRYGRCGVKHIH